MKKIFLLLLVFVNSFVFSQLTINTALTPQQLVQNVLAGSGVTISNVTFNGQSGNILSSQCGFFNGINSNVGINSGMIIGSGDVNVAVGPNNEGGATLGFADVVVVDPDLNTIATADLNDVGVLEFDFVPIGDTVSFKYVFASEEYNEYVCSDFNDVFGFFISGPGINGTFTNNGNNIALIPGTNTAVAINTINNGSAGDSGDEVNCDAIDPNWQAYSVFYNNNSQQSIQYDGMTVVLTAFSPVTCGETYHIKIAIADAFDASFDSGVFLQAGSLTSNGLNVDLSTVTGDTLIFENCTSADFVFTRPESLINETTIVNYSLTGTATEGVDYTDLIDMVTFNPGDDTIRLTLAAFQDGVLEGNETVTITATYTSDCGDLVTIVKTLVITEEPIFDALVNAPEVFCPNDSVEMTIQALGGTPPYLYTWSNGELGDTVPGSINGVGTQTYTVDIIDFCGFTFQSAVTITQSPPPPMDLDLSTDIATCIDESVSMFAFESGGVPPLTITWSNGQTGNFVTGLTATPTYTVTVTDDCNNVYTEDITITFEPDPIINISATDINLQCPDSTVLLNANASGGYQPYTYTWDNNLGTGAQVTTTALSNGNQTFNVTAVDVCGNQSTESVTVTLNQTLSIVSTDQTTSVNCAPTGTSDVTVTGETGNVNYSWNGPGINGPVVSTIQTGQNLATGWYYISVEDNVCQDFDSVFVDILDPVVASFTSSSTIGDLPLNVTFINSSLNADSYDWNFGNGTTVFGTDISIQNTSYNSTNTFVVELIAFQGVCTDTALLEIIILSEPAVNPPNIFTPNNDNTNDYFTLNHSNFKSLNYIIYNRWGNVMFEGDLINFKWNGLLSNGNEANEGSYYYEYSGIGLNNKEINGQGYFQLVRD